MMKRILVLCLGLAVAGCGTTYEVPSLQGAQQARAARMFAEAKVAAPPKKLSVKAAEARFQRTSRRIAKAGGAYCKSLMADKPSFNCDVKIEIDRKLKERNAYFTYVRQQPVIRMSLPLLQDSASDHEIAFVLGHEYGHLIGQHIQKQQQQALAGAFLLGMVAVAAGADPNSGLISDSVELGAAVGGQAYSQTYELESDTLGTRITHAAGYDPVKGAQFFARPEAARTQAGKLSFWGTHPPDAKRLATVLATADQIKAKVGLQKTKKQ